MKRRMQSVTVRLSMQRRMQSVTDDISLARNCLQGMNAEIQCANIIYHGIFMRIGLITQNMHLYIHICCVSLLKCHN